MSAPAVGGATRRELLAAGAAAGLALGWGAVPGWARQKPVGLVAGGRFAQGVASGVTSGGGFVLWTRIDEVEGPARLEVEVARDPEFKRVIHRARVAAAE